jgi:hypothetical protein
MNLDISNWKEFKLSDIFNVKYGVNLELNACEIEDHNSNDAINFVARTAINNGVSAKIKYIDDVTPQSAGLISVAGGGSVLSTFLQNEPFYSGRDLYTLEAKDAISDEAKLFLITVIEQNKYKYSYGRQANKTLPDIILKLPIDKDSNPDYKFMEDYIKSLHYKPLTTKNVKTKKKSLDIAEWKEFKLSSILTVKNGQGITKEEIEMNPGEFPAVQSGEENNGVLGYIDKKYCYSMGYIISESPCLTVARTGSAGFVSFQKEGCVVGDSAKILLLEDEVANTEVYLFLQTVLGALRFKYAYGRKVTEEKYMNELIKLPVKKDSKGKILVDKNFKYSKQGYVPDWEYMKEYMGLLLYGDRL